MPIERDILSVNHIADTFWTILCLKRDLKGKTRTKIIFVRVYAYACFIRDFQGKSCSRHLTALSSLLEVRDSQDLLSGRQADMIA